MTAIDAAIAAARRNLCAATQAGIDTGPVLRHLELLLTLRDAIGGV